MIHHVGLEVADGDVPTVTAFWQLLGWSEVPIPPTITEGGAWLERDGQQIHLLVVKPPSVPHEGHVAIVDAELDAAVTRLTAAGFEADERRQHWGARRVFTRCPAGHRVELMAQPPAPSQASVASSPQPAPEPPSAPTA